MHLVAVISPGPDFAVVLRQGLQKGFAPALWTSFGIAIGILLHVAYSLLGISLLIKTTPWLMNALLYLAAAYFVYIGISGIRSKAPEIKVAEVSENQSSIKQNVNTSDTQVLQSAPNSTWIKDLGLGFLTNGLNPKATLFFLALFTAAIPFETPIGEKVFYGIYLSLATGLWFCILSALVSRAAIRSWYQSHGYWFDRLMGIVLILMAVFLVI